MKKILSIILAITMLFTLAIPTFAINNTNEPIDIVVHGSKGLYYFELNGQIAFCIDPDAARPSDGVDYIYESEIMIPEIENAVIEASLYNGRLNQDAVYKVLQSVIWDILDESSRDYKTEVRKALGYYAGLAFDQFKNAKENTDYSCVFFVYDTSEVPAAGVYQRMATFKIVPIEEVEEDVEEEINYKVNYYLDNTLINSVNCTENEVYTYDVLPEAEAGYNVVGWTDEKGNEFLPETEYSNLTDVNGAEINRYAISSPIEYTVNYYVDDKFVNSVDCVYGETYSYDLFPEAEAGYKILGWTDEYSNLYTPNAQFSNLTIVDGDVINRFAESVLITYKVNYYLDGEFVSSTDCLFGETYTHKELPEVDSSITTFGLRNEKVLPTTITVNGWYDETEKEVSAGTEYSNLAEFDGQEVNFYAFTEYKVEIEEEIEIPTPIAYKVLYYLDGELIDGQLCSKDEVYNYMPLPEAEDGYMVNGWETSNGTYCAPNDEFSNLGKNNGDVIELFAESSPIKYKVNYYFDEELIDSVNCVYDKTYTYNALPSKDGYTVTGWYDIFSTVIADKEFKNRSNVNEDVINLYAYSEEISVEPITYEVHYWLDDTLIDIQYCVENETYSYMILPYPEAGFEINGWTDENGNNFVENDEFTNLTKEANGVVNRYATSKKLSFNVNYYIDNVITYVDEFEYDEVITARPDEEKEGFTFTGWSDIPEVMPAYDVDVYGEFILEDYEIRYYLNDELYTVDRSYFGEKEELIENIEEIGYTFSGWTTKDVIVNTDGSFTMPANDVEFYGKTTPNKYIVNYFVDEKLIETVECTYDEIYTYMLLPEIDGFIVEGWNAEDKTSVIPGADFSNLTAVNGEEINFYATTEKIIVEEPTTEPEEPSTKPEEPTTEPETDILGENDDLPENEPEIEPEKDEEPTTNPEVDVLGDNDTLPEGVVVVDTIPKTGDNDVVLIATVMLLMSAFGFFVLYPRKKKETA